MVYEDIFDAKNACDHLSGFNVCNRYLVVLYYNANRVCMSISVSVDIIMSKGNRRMCCNKCQNKNIALGTSNKFLVFNLCKM